MLKKAFFSCVFVMLLAMPAWAQITVSGEGKVSATPDMATVVLSVVTEDAQASKALDANNESVTKLLKYLVTVGLTKKELRTDLFQLSPKYVTRVGDKEPTFVGYIVVNSLTLTVCQTDMLGKVLDGSVRNGATAVESLRWGFKDSDKLLDKARIAAVLDAKRKATLLVNSAGSTLGTIVSITEAERYSPRSVSYAHGFRAVDSVPIEAGQQTLQVSVSVVWNVGPPLK